MSARTITRLLIANRGEIAIRILRTAADMGIDTVALCSEDDADALPARRADAVAHLPGRGPGVYLDVERIVAAATAHGCDAVHPGYGFLSENAALARRCAAEGVVFVGPAPETLEVFGHKAEARALAGRCGVPTARGTSASPALADAQAFLASLGAGGAIAVKAVAGGGGRGIRIVRHADDLEEALRRCRSEARTAFGLDDVYVEEFIARARHVEVQVVGDGSGDVSHLGERECSIQRHHQKLVEFAPSPALGDALRARLADAALRMAGAVAFRNLGTFEFLVREGAEDDPDAFVFLETNPRLQVEHTVTEAVTGLDLVRLQLELAAGKRLAEIGLEPGRAPRARGVAIQARIYAERVRKDGTIRPSAGTITAFEPPLGPGIRVDAAAYVGGTVSPRFDSLVAKVIAHDADGDFPRACARLGRALRELRLEGVHANVGFLDRLVRHPDFVANRLHTGFVDEHLAELAGDDADAAPEPATPHAARATIDRVDPLAVLDYGKAGDAATGRARAEDGAVDAEDGAVDAEGVTVDAESGVIVSAPMPGTIVSVEVAEGDVVATGHPLVVMEAMKMEHVVAAGTGGVVRRILAAVDETVGEGQALVLLERGDGAADGAASGVAVDLTRVRPDLAEVQERHAQLLDEARPAAVARRRKQGRRTARENVDDLCDAGSFLEYGGLVVAAQRRRRSMEELVRDTPADGLVAGIGTVNGALFGPARTRCAVLAYDYTVFAGTQGHNNHRKTDRLLDVAHQARLPLVLFAEGGGGRPGDTEHGSVFWTFVKFARMSGRAPMVGIAAGFCFAGNAALLGCCDVIIATRDSNIGMGGPAMIEGGGLGVFRPEEIGPTSVQVPNGVIDVLVDDEAAAVAAGKQYLSYFQGPVAEWTCADPRRLRGVIPEDRRRVYDVRNVVHALADTGSVLELRPGFGAEMVTALVRIEGRPLGVVANNPMRLGGAIGSDGADKGARFIQLCDTFGLPLLSLCDTPGIMVGPEAEKSGLVRHTSRMLLASANVSVPFFGVALRKAYGIGKNCMTGGTFATPFLSVAWPTGEFGPMNLEGAVKLAFRKELAAIQDPAARRARYDEMVAELYQQGKALSVATDLQIDDVIDPADTRRWILAGLDAWPPSGGRGGRPFLDAW